MDILHNSLIDDSSNGLGLGEERPVRRLTDALVTQILDNNLHELEDLRRSIERAQRKDVADVREFDTIGAVLLRGVESPIGYHDLVDLITDLRQGLARRRTA